MHTRHPKFEKISTVASENNPIVTVCILLSSERKESDYAYLARQLVEVAGLSPFEVVHAWVTDGEVALIKGMKSQPQFSHPESRSFLQQSAPSV
ncbi:MAG: hypothetical protein GY821_00945 [Gammaproteobacteria bacterium]|nr:hypothetical protein [Gammaproteobacteria bacterium]